MYGDVHADLLRRLRPAPLLIPLLLAASLAAPAAPAAASAAAARVLRDWPCQGCLVVVPPKVRRHAPLLVALHGDEGDPGLVASMWGPVAAARGVVLFAPQCPTAEGCRFANGASATNSWWGWLQSGGQYDDDWIGRETRLVQQRFAVDPRREYLEGWSGGADFLGWYALRHATRFAAAAFVAGGVPYSSSCPSHALPAFFLGGDADFRTASGQPAQVRAILDRCGSPTENVVVPGADHQAAIMSLQTQSRGSEILRWLLRHHR